MFLLIHTLSLWSFHIFFIFKFQYDSINSNTLGERTSFFKFHYDSINSDVVGALASDLILFKFHYDSINSIGDIAIDIETGAL